MIHASCPLEFEYYCRIILMIMVLPTNEIESNKKSKIKLDIVLQIDFKLK